MPKRAKIQPHWSVRFLGLLQSKAKSIDYMTFPSYSDKRLIDFIEQQ